MISSEWIYWLLGLVFIGYGNFALRDVKSGKRYGTAAFWIILGLSFAYGTFVEAGTAPAWVLGIAVLAFTTIVDTRQLVTDTGSGPNAEQQRVGADRFGNRLLIPALIIPLVTLIFSTALDQVAVGSSLPPERRHLPDWLSLPSWRWS